MRAWSGWGSGSNFLVLLVLLSTYALLDASYDGFADASASIWARSERSWASSARAVRNASCASPCASRARSAARASERAVKL